MVVNVTDVNDNRPKFLHDHYEAKLYEHSNDFESIVRVTATDQDAIATPNSEIRYLIVNSSIWSNYFKINQQLSIITLWLLCSLNGSNYKVRVQLKQLKLQS